MVIGRVVGRLWATRKDEKLNGQKFLIPVDATIIGIIDSIEVENE